MKTPVLWCDLWQKSWTSVKTFFSGFINHFGSEAQINQPQCLCGDSLATRVVLDFTLVLHLHLMWCHQSGTVTVINFASRTLQAGVSVCSTQMLWLLSVWLSSVPRVYHLCVVSTPLPRVSVLTANTTYGHLNTRARKSSMNGDGFYHVSKGQESRLEKCKGEDVSCCEKKACQGPF